jgi:hypothetical protein
MHIFYNENDAEIFPANYTWMVAEKSFKMAFMMNKLAIINSCEIILENYKYFFAKNLCEIQVSTINVCALYSIKYYGQFQKNLRRTQHMIYFANFNISLDTNLPTNVIKLFFLHY